MKIIELHDTDSYTELMDQKEDTTNGIQLELSNPVHYKTDYNTDITHYSIKSRGQHLFFFDTGSESDNEWLYAKQPDWFLVDNIENMVNNSDTYLFAEPEDTNNIDYDKLEFTDYFELDDIPYNKIVSYDLVCNGVCTVGLYKTDNKDTDNPYIFVIWSGMGANAVMELYEGRMIVAADVKFIN